MIPISPSGGIEPVWSPAGGEPFYRNGDRMLVVPIATEPTFQVGSPTVLFEAPYAHDRNSMGIPYYDVSSDGQRFLMVRTTVAEPATVTVGLNWFEELERLAPRR